MNGIMATKRFKDGKVHRYWSMVESVRVGRHMSQRQALYLGPTLGDSGVFTANGAASLDALGSNGSVSNLTVRLKKGIMRFRGNCSAH